MNDEPTVIAQLTVSVLRLPNGSTATKVDYSVDDEFMNRALFSAGLSCYEEHLKEQRARRIAAPTNGDIRRILG